MWKEKSLVLQFVLIKQISFTSMIDKTNKNYNKKSITPVVPNLLFDLFKSSDKEIHMADKKVLNYESVWLNKILSTK
jgi:hypothetical protein